MSKLVFSFVLTVVLCIADVHLVAQSKKPAPNPKSGSVISEAFRKEGNETYDAIMRYVDRQTETRLLDADKAVDHLWRRARTKDEEDAAGVLATMLAVIKDGDLGPLAKMAIFQGKLSRWNERQQFLDRYAHGTIAKLESEVLIACSMEAEAYFGSEPGRKWKDKGIERGICSKTMENNTRALR